MLGPEGGSLTSALLGGISSFSNASLKRFVSSLARFFDAALRASNPKSPDLATALLVHGNLELPETSYAMDICNACIGFSNGLLTLAGLIESGVVKAGVVVSGETVTRIMDSSMKMLLNDPTVTREKLLKNLPTFTLGSGGVAWVLSH